MNNPSFKPMLAGKPDSDDQVPMPCIASPKIDGVRATANNGALLSRSLKLIPNKLVQAVLGMDALHGLDGELVCGPVNAPNVMQATASVVMSIEKQEPFEYHVFDYWDSSEGFRDRLLHAGGRLLSIQKEWTSLLMQQRLGGGSTLPEWALQCPIRLVPHKLINTLQELETFEAECLENGYEGAMVRAPDGLYKHGRSTVREGGLLKLKRFSDGEAIIVDFVEEMKNNNVATTNELGRTKRSSHAAGKEGKGTLGAFVCKRLSVNEKGILVTGDVTFNIGTGMDAAFRAEAWAKRETYMNQVVKFKHFEHGVVDAPRHPVFLGMRAKWDMS